MEGKRDEKGEAQKESSHRGFGKALRGELRAAFNDVNLTTRLTAAQTPRSG